MLASANSRLILPGFYPAVYPTAVDQRGCSSRTSHASAPEP